MKKKILILILSVFLVVPFFSVDAINYKNDYDNFDKNSIELLAKNNGESYLENDEQEIKVDERDYRDKERELNVRQGDVARRREENVKRNKSNNDSAGGKK